MRCSAINGKTRRFGPVGHGGGFTLLELLLVLALLVVIAAMAAPAASSIFAGQQLRNTGDVIRARFADCRVRAIRTGNIYGFFYQPGGGSYWIAPVSSGFQALSGNAPPPTAFVLESDVKFVAGETMHNSRSRAASEDIGRNFSDYRPVLFYPDGTSQDAVVIIESPRGLRVQVELRGLTGVAKRSMVRAQGASQ